MPDCVIHWFRRDLRLRDNTALSAALGSGSPVVGVFILDDYILRQSTIGPRRLHFLRTALKSLDDELASRGSHLLVCRGDAARELNRVAQATGAWGVYFNRDYTPYARQRDTRATRGMQMIGVVTQAFADLLLVEPFHTLDDEQRPAYDFSSFQRRWLKALEVDSLLDGGVSVDDEGTFLNAAEIPSPAPEWKFALAPDMQGDCEWPGSTPASAQLRLRHFVEESLARYPDHATTSLLSAALKFGTISVRGVLAATAKRAAQDPALEAPADRFIAALARRDHAAHLLHAHPQLLRRRLRDIQRAVAVDAQPAGNNAGNFEAWLEGRTGDAAVDAAMRRLSQEGFIGDRERMQAATYLARQPGGDWRAGERHFLRSLIDADLAINDWGWQQAAAVAMEDQPEAEGGPRLPSRS